MMTEQEKYEWIEAYLEGTLTAEQQNTFARWQKEDPQLAQEIEQHREVQEAVGPSSANRVRRLTQEVLAENRSKAVIRPLSSRSWLGVAAAILLLIVAGWWIYSSSATMPERIFSEYYALPIHLGITRGDGLAANEPGESLQTELDSLYRIGAYEEAVRLLETQGRNMPAYASSDYHYSLGVLYLQTGRPEQAIQSLEQVAVVHLNEKAWYLALTALKIGQIEEAKAQFTAIGRSDSPYRQEAQQILSRLH